MTRFLARWSRPILVAALLVVAVLLLRIASGGTFQDWPHVFREGSRMFVADILAAVTSIGLAGVVATRIGPAVDRACAIWAVASLALGLVLLARHDDSAKGILGLSVVALGMAIWRIRGSPDLR